MDWLVWWASGFWSWLAQCADGFWPSLAQRLSYPSWVTRWVFLQPWMKTEQTLYLPCHAVNIAAYYIFTTTPKNTLYEGHHPCLSRVMWLQHDVACHQQMSCGMHCLTFKHWMMDRWLHVTFAVEWHTQQRDGKNTALVAFLLPCQSMDERMKLIILPFVTYPHWRYKVKYIIFFIAFEV